jgi:hypothetical protein
LPFTGSGDRGSATAATLGALSPVLVIAGVVAFNIIGISLTPAPIVEHDRSSPRYVSSPSDRRER